MSALPTTTPPSIGHLLAEVVDEVAIRQGKARRAYYDAFEKALAKGEVLPNESEWDLFVAGRAKPVRQVATMLRKAELPPWLTHDQVTEGTVDLIDSVLDRVRGWPEFATIEGEPIQIRWSCAAMVQRDIVSEQVILGRAKVVPKAERLTWEGETEPPAFRLDLSLPCALLATVDELERGLHALLACFGMGSSGPVLRKPDIVAHASTLGRFGINGIREGYAVAHAMRHPSTARRLVEYHFDAATGQGLMWSPKRPQQTDIREDWSEIDRAEAHAAAIASAVIEELEPIADLADDAEPVSSKVLNGHAKRPRGGRSAASQAH